mgnify:CR=1 FL=1
MSNLFFCLSASFALLCIMNGAPGAQEQQGDLDERLRAKDAELRKRRQEIAEHRKKIEEVEKREKDITDYIARLDKDGVRIEFETIEVPA